MLIVDLRLNQALAYHAAPAISLDCHSGSRIGRSMLDNAVQ